MRTLSISLLVLFLLSGCSSPRNFYVESDYSENKIDSNVLVVPIKRSWFPNNRSHTFGSLSGKGQTSFYNYFEDVLANKISSNVEMIPYEQHLDEKLFTSSKLEIGSDSIDVLLPTPDIKFESGDFDPEVVLLLDKYFFRKVMKRSGRASYAGREGGQKRYQLYFETNYIFWQIEKQKPIAWGTTSGITDLPSTGDANSQKYYQAILRAAEKISDQGPVL